MTLEFDLYEIAYGSGTQTNFTSQLLRLVLKADSDNREKLRLGFPAAVAAVERYKKTGEVEGFPKGAKDE